MVSLFGIEAWEPLVVESQGKKLIRWCVKRINAFNASLSCSRNSQDDPSDDGESLRIMLTHEEARLDVDTLPQTLSTTPFQNIRTAPSSISGTRPIVQATSWVTTSLDPHLHPCFAAPSGGDSRLLSLQHHDYSTYPSVVASQKTPPSRHPQKNLSLPPRPPRNPTHHQHLPLPSQRSAEFPAFSLQRCYLPRPPTASPSTTPSSTTTSMTFSQSTSLWARRRCSSSRSESFSVDLARRPPR